MPNSQETLIFLRVGGEQFDFWTEYTCGASIFEPDSPFEFSAPIISDRELREVNGINLVPGKVVQVYVRTPSNRPKAVLQYVGIIDTVKYVASREGGAMLHVTGRNHLAPIVDSDVLPNFSVENVTFAEVIKRVLVTPAPGNGFGYYSQSQIIINNDANRSLLTGNPKAANALSKNAPPQLETLKIDQAKPRAGETVYQYLHRHATRMGLMIWGTGDGKIVFGRPNFDQQPLYSIAMRRNQRGVDNTAKAWAYSRSYAHRASEIHVYGHSHGGDSMRSPIHAVVKDQEIIDSGLYRPVTIHDNCARTVAQAEQRGRLELAKRLQSANQLTVKVQGHGADGSTWAPDTIVSLFCDDLGMVDEQRYIVARTFTRSRDHGTETTLHIVPKNSIPLGEIQYVPPKTIQGAPSTSEVSDANAMLSSIPLIGGVFAYREMAQLASTLDVPPNTANGNTNR